MATGASFTSESAGGSGSEGASGSLGTSGSGGASGHSGEKEMRPPRSSTPAPSSSSAALASAEERQRRGRSRSRSPRRRRAQGRDEGREKFQREDLPRERGHRNKRTAQEVEPNSDEFKFSHVLVKHKESRRPIDQYNKPITRTKDEAMELVCDIHKKILKDLITFADAAVSFSDCTSAENEGDIQSQFKSGKMPISFKNTATALAPGQISNVVETKAGYHILQRRE